MFHALCSVTDRSQFFPLKLIIIRKFGGMSTKLYTCLASFTFPMQRSTNIFCKQVSIKQKLIIVRFPKVIQSKWIPPKTYSNSTQLKAI